MLSLLVSPINDRTSESLIKKISRVLPQEQFAVFHTLDDLQHFLTNRPGDTEIVVLRAHSREDLVGFQAIKDFMHDIKILLIVPDRKKRTLDLAHQLHPRYVVESEGNFDNLILVVKKILQRKMFH